MTAGIPAARASTGEVLEVCARHADALAGQVEAAERVVAGQIRQLRYRRVRDACDSAEWLRSTLRVLACSLGELHTVLDEVAAGGEAVR